MAWVYILRGSSGSHYIGSCLDLDARLAQHLRGHTAITERLGVKLAIVAKKEVTGLEEARRMRTSTETQEEFSSAPFLSATVEQVGSLNPPDILLLRCCEVWA